MTNQGYDRRLIEEATDKNKARAMKQQHLKWIALLTMLADHIAIRFSEIGAMAVSGTAYTVLRSVGRIGFPLFCFLLCEGWEKTSDREAYLRRLLGFSLISQLPYSLFFGTAAGTAWTAKPIYLLVAVLAAAAAALLLGAKRTGTVILAAAAASLTQITGSVSGLCLFGSDLNTIYTLTLALISFLALERFMEEHCSLWSISRDLPAILLVFLALYQTGPRCSYGWLGILLPVMLRCTRKKKWAQLLMLALWCSAKYLDEPAYFFGAMLYDGEKGKAIFPRSFFYLFYPVHLLLIFGAALLIRP